MGIVRRICPVGRLRGLLPNSRGLSLLLVVFLMAAVGIAAVGTLTFGVKMRGVQKERITPMRLETVRRALQRYYLSHHDLPPPSAPGDAIPVVALNLPQEFRFDKDGQFMRYERRTYPEMGAVAGAELRAPGFDRVIQTNDDVVVDVSLQAEAIKIAARAVAILQAAAKAYDGQYLSRNDFEPYAVFDNINNDGDTCFLPRYVDCSDPQTPTVITPRPPVPIIDEGDCLAEPCGQNPGYVRAQGGKGPRCAPRGKLTNDPDRGTASLDACNSDNVARAIGTTFGLNRRYVVDPWGNPYQWGAAGQYGGLDPPGTDAQRDRHYWAFYSMGPDGDPNTYDDITPTTDFIVGYQATDPTADSMPRVECRDGL